MQEKIAKGAEFTYHDKRSARIIPKEANPVVDKRQVEIPIENSQADPTEPRRKAKRNAKTPAKKFHMPDGVETGFAFLGNGRKPSKRAATSQTDPVERPSIDQDIASLPSLETVLLSREDEEELDQSYCTISGDTPQEVRIPRLDTLPSCQRGQQITSRVAHSTAAQRVVRAYGRMQNRDLYSIMPPQTEADWLDNDTVQDDLLHAEVEENPSGEDSTPLSTSIAATLENQIPERHHADDHTAIRTLGDNDCDIAEITPLKVLQGKEIANVPFYISQQSAADDDDGLEQDLPDFETMVCAKKASQGKVSNSQTTRKTMRSRRLVLDDDDSD
jgi:hypothetical protein